MFLTTRILENKKVTRNTEKLLTLSQTPCTFEWHFQSHKTNIKTEPLHILFQVPFLVSAQCYLSKWVPVSITKFMEPLKKHSLLLWPLPQFALSIFIETNKNKALVLVYIELLVWSLMRLHFWVAWYLQRVQGYLFLHVLPLIREGQAIPNWSFGSEFLESSFGSA